MSVAAYLLGAPVVVRDGTVYAAPKGRKAWALLAYLALSDRAPTRQQLIDFLNFATGPENQPCDAGKGRTGVLNLYTR